MFLDEIGELPLAMQVKLLRVIQEKRFEEWGNTVCSNQRENHRRNEPRFKRNGEKGEFREDLYYRISVVPIEIPPLRRRKNDIKPLLIHFLDKYNRKYRKSCYFVPEVFEKLQEYEWPGNVRELANMVERLVITCPEDAIRPEYIPEIRENRNVDSHGSRSRVMVPEINGEIYNLSGFNRSFQSLNDFISHLEREILAEAYERFHSSYQVAQNLGISQSTAMRKAYKYGIREKGSS